MPFAYIDPCIRRKSVARGFRLATCCTTTPSPMLLMACTESRSGTWEAAPRNRRSASRPVPGTQAPGFQPTTRRQGSQGRTSKRDGGHASGDDSDEQRQRAPRCPDRAGPAAWIRISVTAATIGPETVDVPSGTSLRRSKHIGRISAAISMSTEPETTGVMSGRRSGSHATTAK